MRARMLLLIAGLIPVAPWIAALASAWSFYSDATVYVAQAGSLDAHNDLAFSRVWLTAYGVGLFAGLASAVWLACKRSARALVTATWAAAFGMALLAGDHARPVCIVPTGGALLAAFSVTGVILACTLMATHFGGHGHQSSVANRRR